MPLLETIADHMKLAMKSGEKLRLETLRSIRAGLLEMQVEKRPSGGMTAEDELSVLNSQVKKRRESIMIFRQHGRNELADQEESELAIIMEYLPKQLSQEEVEKAVAATIAVAGARSQKDFGKVMPLAMKELKGKTDGKIVQDIVKRLLEQEERKNA